MASASSVSRLRRRRGSGRRSGPWRARSGCGRGCGPRPGSRSRRDAPRPPPAGGRVRVGIGLEVRAAAARARAVCCGVSVGRARRWRAAKVPIIQTMVPTTATAASARPAITSAVLRTLTSRVSCPGSSGSRRGCWPPGAAAVRSGGRCPRSVSPARIAGIRPEGPPRAHAGLPARRGPEAPGPRAAAAPAGAPAARQATAPAASDVARPDHERSRKAGVTSQNISRRARRAPRRPGSGSSGAPAGGSRARPGPRPRRPRSPAPARAQPPRAKYHVTSEGRFADQTIRNCTKCR